MVIHLQVEDLGCKLWFPSLCFFLSYHMLHSETYRCQHLVLAQIRIQSSAVFVPWNIGRDEKGNKKMRQSSQKRNGQLEIKCGQVLPCNTVLCQVWESGQIDLGQNWGWWGVVVVVKKGTGRTSSSKQTRKPFLITRVQDGAPNLLSPSASEVPKREEQVGGSLSSPWKIHLAERKSSWNFHF